MSRDKQIEEMAKICCNTCEFGCGFNGECDLGNDYRTCGVSKETAEALYNAGYRKTSDIAREIFEEIDRMIYKVLNDRHYIMGDMCYEVAGLKKKYTEEGK